MWGCIWLQMKEQSKQAMPHRRRAAAAAAAGQHGKVQSTGTTRAARNLHIG